jgi:Putative zinc-finger
MRCTEARPLFPVYLDNAATGAEMQALSDHMSACPECRLEYRKLENTRLLVASLGRKQVPADLALKIRLAVSRQRSRTLQRILQAYMVRLEDAFNAFMFPATAGILTAIIFFGALTGFFVPAQIGADDLVPGIYLPARLQPPQTAMSSVADTDLNLDTPVVIQAFVDVSGRVQNYEIISGPDNEGVRSQLNRVLLFTSFSPAYAYGQPVPGTAIICFSHVNVKG